MQYNLFSENTTQDKVFQSTEHDNQQSTSMHSGTGRRLHLLSCKNPSLTLFNKIYF